MNLEDLKRYKSVIYSLSKQQREEKDYEKKREKGQELKAKLEEILEILPEDTDILIKLMFTNISLNQYEEARKIGYQLYEKVQNRDVLNGLAISEERLENYEKSLNFLNQMLQREPNNGYIKAKIDRVKNKQSRENKKKSQVVSSKQYKYRQIADLERKVRWLAEQEQKKTIIGGNEKGYDIILQEKYIEIYSQVAEKANSIIIEYPQEIVAREKLVKALFITQKIEEAEQEAKELLQLNEKDEIAIWYMSRINRKRDDLYGEKQYLEKLIEVSQPISQIKAQQRLEKVKSLIDKQEIKRELEKAKQEAYIEEKRQEFIEDIEKSFLEGTIRLDDIDKKIEEAKKYPNLTESLISILNIKVKMTGNLQVKIDGLEKYVDNTQTLTPEQYNRILDEIAQTRKQAELERKIESSINRKYAKEAYDDSDER